MKPSWTWPGTARRRAGPDTARWLLTGWLVLLGLTGIDFDARGASEDANVRIGEAIYRHGLLGTGQPLQGSRAEDGPVVSGADAACVNCHQRSGLGTAEANVSIPPVTGRYLFHPRAERGDEFYLPYVPGVRSNREPYTEDTLVRALRDGIDAQGRPLSYLMPRFALNDADAAALVAYLKSLDMPRPPGVTDTVLHFATIVTPDADPVKRDGVLDVLQHYFTDKNSFQFGPSARLQSSGKTMYSKTMYMVNRRWQLHIWTLTGPPSTWGAQLDRHFAQEPVLAVVSGIGGAVWAPVHDFCERQAVPCLFPNVDAPTYEAGDFYTLYFSRGVLLEAELMSKAILDARRGAAAPSVAQIYRDGDSGAAAAAALEAALAPAGVAVRNHVIPAGADAAQLRAAVRKAGHASALALWLRPADLAALGDAPLAGDVYLSGLMGGLDDSPLPTAWRERARMTYPFDLPDKRLVRVDYALGWLSIRHVPIVSQRVQVDTYLACGLLAEALSHMRDTFVPAYLVEELQSMVEHRVITGYYPHLALGTGQTFASKGGYLVQLPSSGGRLVADSAWVVP